MEQLRVLQPYLFRKYRGKKGETKFLDKFVFTNSRGVDNEVINYFNPTNLAFVYGFRDMILNNVGCYDRMLAFTFYNQLCILFYNAIRQKGILFATFLLHRIAIFIQPGKTDKSSYLTSKLKSLRENLTRSREKIFNVVLKVILCPHIRLSLVRESDMLTGAFSLATNNIGLSLWLKGGKFPSLLSVYESFSLVELCKREQMETERSFYGVGEKVRSLEKNISSLVYRGNHMTTRYVEPKKGELKNVNKNHFRRPRCNIDAIVRRGLAAPRLRKRRVKRETATTTTTTAMAVDDETDIDAILGKAEIAIAFHDLQCEMLESEVCETPIGNDEQYFLL